MLFVAFQDQLTMERGFTSAIYINWAVILHRQNGKDSYEPTCYRFRLQGESQSSKRALLNSIGWAVYKGIGSYSSTLQACMQGYEVIMMTMDDS